MIEHKRNINSVIHDQLTGELSEEDRKRLDEWLNHSPENREEYNRFLSGRDLTDRYQAYLEADDVQAWKLFQKRHFKMARFSWAKIGRYAAMLLLPVAGTVIGWWLWSRADSKPVVLPETRVTMMRSEQVGKQKATLILADGEKVNLESALHRTLQKAEEPTAPSVPSSTENETGMETATESGSLAKSNQLLTHPDSEYWVTFEDGTIVHLNYNTTLKYPSHFGSRHRTVYLDGEAYFQVAKESGRPFRVVTPAGVVTEYGTSFNVNTYTKGCTKVVLVEGSIGVTPGRGNERMIKPGELAVFRSQTADVQVNKVDIEPYIAWNGGRFVFDNCSLESLMEVISRWYNRKVVFETEEIKQMRFTGDLDKYGSVVPVMKAIQRVTGLDVETNKERIVLRKNYINN